MFLPGITLKRVPQKIPEELTRSVIRRIEYGAFIFSIWIAGLLTGCDSEKFFGFNYRADQVADSINIMGQVTNRFTGQPVVEANVQVGDQETLTDEEGRYRVSFPLDTDVDRNKPIPFKIMELRYFPLDSTIIVYPVDRVLDVRLTYGAPIVQNSVRVNTVCQAIVFDYQGIDDVDSILAIFTYVIVRGPHTDVAVPMNQVGNDEDKTGYYQCQVQWSIPSLGTLVQNRYFVQVFDKEGFVDKYIFFPEDGDTLLFPITE